MEWILGKMGEIVLKGMNRRSFESRMLKNLRYRLQRHGSFKVSAMQSTVYVEPEDGADMDAAFEVTKKLFGLNAVSRAFSCEKDVDDIVRVAADKLGPALMAARTFKVESKRADKNFPLTSPALSIEVGGRLHDLFGHLKADMTAPEVTVFVEIRDYAAFVHTDPAPGAGGLPVGSSGKAACLLSGGIDSPVAAYMAAKRGLELEMVHFFSYPYTSERAKQKVLDLAQILTGYCGRLSVHVVPFTAIQEAIQARCDEELFTLIMRRSMMRISEAVAKTHGCDALITGESLGQVASQTIRALGVTEAAVSLPVLRPVIGMDKEEIVTIARRIETFETSILPYEDCCTVFTPRHPKTKPRLADVEKSEAAAELLPLEAAAVEGIELVVQRQ